MGRDWLHWGGNSHGCAGGGGSTRRGRMAPEDTPGGCMCAVFHIFDLHPFHFPLNQQHHPESMDFLKQEANSSKGIEAPRNSLETEAAMNQEHNFNFPGRLQIKTRVSTNSTTADNCSTTSSGTTTPSLVARLMGLDMLPHCSSPSSTSTISRLQTKSRSDRRKERNILRRRSSRSFSDDDISVGIRSLPETPRMSLGRRSDVECHRLSLNVNKENVSEEFAVGRRKGRFRQDEDRSPGNYARQIADQVPESVSRRVGQDITNINRDNKEMIRRDEHLIPLKTNKNNSKVSPSLEGEMRPDEGKQTVRLPDIKKGKQIPNSGTRSPRIPTSCHKGTSDPLRSNNRVKNEAGTASNMKKFHPQWPDQAIRNKKEEAFVHSAGPKKANLTDKKKCKKAPLSNELLNTSGPTILPVKKAPSPPATKLPQKQMQASDALTSKRNTQLCSSKKTHSYKQLHLDLEPVNTAPDKNNRCGSAPAAEYKYYIQRILKRTGIIDGVTQLKLGKWHSSSQPLDPSIFYYLELFHPSAGAASAALLSRRCNWKLIFQLVDELLLKILKPYLDFNPWCNKGFRISSRLGLLDELCEKIEGFPAAKCEVLEDIDSLIEGDLCNWKIGGIWEEDGPTLARDIEGEIMDSLLIETAETLGVRNVQTIRNNK